MPQTSIIHNGQEYRFQDTESAQAFIDQIPSPRGDLQIEGGTQLFRLLNEIGAPMLNWKEINAEICNEWDQTFLVDQSESNWPLLSVKRVDLLALFKSVMDIAETAVVPEDVQVIREAREKQYNLFIVQESVIGGDVCVETLYAVTEREIRAGRMDASNNLRKVAIDGIAQQHFTRAELIAQKQPAKETFFQKLKNFF
jgi:hypothetical protein